MIVNGFLCFAAVCAVLSVFSNRMKKSVFFLWAAGVSLSIFFLLAGGEFLSVACFIFSTLLMSTQLYVLSLQKDYKEKLLVSDLLVPIGMGVVFSAIVSVCLGESVFGFFEFTQAVDLKDFGKRILSTHLLSVVVLSLFVFLAVIGIGILGRSEEKSETPARDV